MFYFIDYAFVVINVCPVIIWLCNFLMLMLVYDDKVIMTVEDLGTDRQFFIHNPPSLEQLCTRRIRQSISCIGLNGENNIVKKWITCVRYDLRNLNIPTYLQHMSKYLYLLSMSYS